MKTAKTPLDLSRQSPGITVANPQGLGNAGDYNPSTDLAMMFFCTSFEPPNIVHARLFR